MYNFLHELKLQMFLFLFSKERVGTELDVEAKLALLATCLHLSNALYSFP
jgi:hypothetical protein